MKQRLTPNYDHEKLANPNLADLIDVFEDAWKGYFLAPAQVLLNTPNGDIAAMILLSPYFESIEALHQGRSSDGQSARFFVDGFLRVFDNIQGPADERDARRNAAKAIYREVRCRAVHTGFPSNKVGRQRLNQKAFNLTYRRLPDGQLDTEGPVQSILFNAQRIHDAVRWHLEHYVKVLRQPQESNLKDNFDRLMRSEWGIGEGDNLVGMTEEDFVNRT